MEVLRSFYGSIDGVVKSITIDYLPKGFKISEESKGQWALEQIENAARTLSVLEFVLPFKDGGIAIPKVNSLEQYKIEESRQDHDKLERLKDALKLRGAKYAKVQAKL